MSNDDQGFPLYYARRKQALDIQYEADEFLYHEAQVQPGLLLLDAPPASAHVIGGGEGATLREILRYPSIKKAVMVDIDAEVVELCKRHLPEMHQGAFDDPRTEFRAEDSRGYLERTAERTAR